MPGLFRCFPEVHFHHGRVRSVPALVKRLFNEATNGKESMNALDLSGFISRVQGDSFVDEVKAADIIGKCNSEGGSHSHRLFGSHSSRDSMSNVELDLQGFYNYLLHSDLNSAEATSSKPTQDMTAPLSHYYIYSSHNSYLTGNQLTSRSSTEPIVKALQDGCRVIELDCWGRKGKIMVLHGGTLTKAVPFADCITAIKENAFVASEYPVIITIENHLSLELQQQAAQILVSTLGNLLFIPPAEERPPKVYRSPEDLKGKIIISDKPRSEAVEEQVQEDPDGAVGILPEVAAIGERPVENDPPRKLGPGMKGTKTKAAQFTVQKAAAAMDAIAHHRPDSVEEDQQIATEFEHLLYIYCEKPSEMKQAVKDLLVAGETRTMANMSEPQLKRVIEKNPGCLLQYTRTNLGRMYPFGLRVDSSNADPMLAWSYGFQLAAMNMQGSNRATWIGRAFFNANGGCGYVKKPDHFLDDRAADIQTLPPKLILKVRVLAGTDWHKHFDIFKKPDFYVKVGIHGVDADEADHKTPVAHKSREPLWETEIYEFPLTVPEIAVLRLEVWEDDKFQRNKFAGQACIHVKVMQPGIRVVPLFSKKGVARGSKLLLEIVRESVNGFSLS